MQTRGDRRRTLLALAEYYVYKEVWVHSTGRWLWLMQDLAGPALVEGRVPAGALGNLEFLEASTGRTIEVSVDRAGSFRSFVPEGSYTLRHGNERASLTALPGGTYRIDLRPGRALDFPVASQTDRNGEVLIQLNATGDGRHTFAIRTDNLAVDQSPKDLTLAPANQSRSCGRASCSRPPDRGSRSWFPTTILPSAKNWWRTPMTLGRMSILALAAAVAAIPLTRPTYEVLYTGEPIHVDGKLDEPAWAAAPPWEPSSTIATARPAPSRPKPRSSTTTGFSISPFATPTRTSGPP